MWSTLLLPLCLAGLSLAQDLPTDAYESIMATVTPDAPPFGQVSETSTPTYDRTSAISEATAEVATPTSLAKVRRQAACTTRSYNGPQVTEPADSDSAFLSYEPFSNAAQVAAVPSSWPAEYKLVPGFLNLRGSGQSTSYITYTAQLSGYNLAECAAKCDSIVGCVSFNICKSCNAPSWNRRLKPLSQSSSGTRSSSPQTRKRPMRALVRRTTLRRQRP